MAISIACLEEPFQRLFLFVLCLAFLLTEVTRRICQHHPKRLIIKPPHNVVDAPAGGGGYLPHHAEGAMATLVA
ncbi:hypothetical protein [Porphyromonas gingivalis]|nr:hypothetical protein [Porphyromonas gingivalis]